MNKINLYGKLLVVFIVILGSFYLRYRDFDKVPFAGESMDEYSYSWVGISLLKYGIPVGISGIDGYENSLSEYINIDNVYQGTAGGNPVTINWPWFDHPPMLGLITGGYSILEGARNFSETNIYIIRKPMLVLGTLSVLLVLIFGWINFGFMGGMISGIVYGSMPIAVIGSRMVQGENGVIPAYLSVLIFLSLYIKRQKKYWLVLAAVFSGVACLFKISGVVTIICGVFFLQTYRKEKVWEFLTIALSIASLFFIYGLAIDGERFVTIFLSNSQRYYGIGAEAIYRLLTQVKITNVKYLTDPTILMGWLGFIAIIIKKNINIGEKLLVLIGIIWLAVYLTLGSYAHGWYAFPFYPILALSLGRLWSLAWKKSEYLLGVGLVWLVGIGQLVSRFIGLDEFQKYAPYWKYSISILLVGLLFIKFGFKESNIVKRIILIILLVFLESLCVYLLLSTNVDSWYKTW